MPPPQAGTPEGLYPILAAAFPVTLRCLLSKASPAHKFGQTHAKTHLGLATDLAYIRSGVDHIRSQLPNAEFASPGPITLTEFGNSIAKDIDARAVLDRHLKTLKAEIQKKGPDNPYQLQQICMNAIPWKDILSATELETASKAAFNRGVRVEDVLAVLAIHLRDIFLPDYGWKETETDNYG